MFVVNKTNLVKASEAGVSAKVIKLLEVGRVFSSEASLRTYLEMGLTQQVGNQNVLEDKDKAMIDKHIPTLAITLADPWSARNFNNLEIGKTLVLDKEVRLRIRKVPGGVMYEYYDKEGDTNACQFVDSTTAGK